jgi:hypothetical protein
VEFFAIAAVVILLWLGWQLFQAKRFSKFKVRIEQELKPQVIKHICADLEENRSEIFPNNQCHQEAALFYWTQYKSRILQAALQREIIDTQWLKDTGNLRNSQHLFHVEQRFLQR